MNDVLESALNYAREGFQVFPLQSNSKSKQIVKSWKEKATTDNEVIQNWFSNTDYNVGVRTGNGFIVIDIDNKSEVNGYESIKLFLKDFPSTKIVKTPNNGWHMYYRVDREISCRTGIVKGVDIRGDGGYVVGIGSVVNGNRYFVSRDEPIAQANEAIYRFLEMKSMNRKNLEVEEGIYQGKRNDYLFRMGCFLQQKGFSDEAIECCLKKENEWKCNPPLDEKEINQIIKSSLHYNKGFIGVRNSIHYEGSYTVEELLVSKDNDEPDIVEDMISVGLTLLGAPQKCGKTFFGLQLCNAIANGKNFLGKKVQKGTTLYLAFEDTMPKIRKRLKTMKVESSTNFVVDILKSNPDYDVESRIQRELNVHPNLKIVIVDTFAKIRKSKDRDYESEYAEAAFYHELALKYGIAILLITHLKKDIDVNHPFDSIYGSRGLTAVDINVKKNTISFRSSGFYNITWGMQDKKTKKECAHTFTIFAEEYKLKEINEKGLSQINYISSYFDKSSLNIADDISRFIYEINSVMNDDRIEMIFVASFRSLVELVCKDIIKRLNIQFDKSDLGPKYDRIMKYALKKIF